MGISIEDFKERNGIENDDDMPQYLEPWDTFSGGIIGLSDDGDHIVYGYYKTANALAKQYEADWRNTHPNEEPSEDEDFYIQAIEWLDYNTLRSLPYQSPAKRPIVVTEMDDL